MPDRRQFLKQIGAAGAVACGATRVAAQNERTSRPLRILVLGGTGAIGPYHVRAAVARGHQVAVFSRGNSRADLPSSVERLIGDRNGDLKAIQNREWDAVMDIAAFGPGWIRSLGQAMAERVGHYTFISTVSVYDKPEANEMTHEDSPVLAYTGATDPYAEVTHVGDQYGALKVLCEREAEKQFLNRTLVLRPGYIGGPGDNRALTYWAVRAAQGGEILAGGDSAAPVQYIDVRDMAEWAIRMAENRATGIYNSVGPATPTSVGGILEAARNALAPSSNVTWVPASWLNSRKDGYLWGTLLFWQQGVGNIMRMSNQRALAKGLTTRPTGTTLTDCLEWYKQQPPEQRATLITGFRRKDDGSGWAQATESWSNYLQREREALAAWRAEQAAA